jgi:hypothetical protein
MDLNDLKQASTWAVVLYELLAELIAEYRAAVQVDLGSQSREYARAQTLLARSREAADRMVWEAGNDGQESDLRNGVDRLTFAVRHQRLKPAVVDAMASAVQRSASQYRSSTLTRIGAFVLRQVLRRDRARRSRATDHTSGATKPHTA